MSTLTLILINIGAAATLSCILAVVMAAPVRLLGPAARGSDPRRGGSQAEPRSVAGRDRRPAAV